MKNFKTVICPAGNYLGLTAGKEYEVTNVDLDVESFWIKTDEGVDFFCLIENCAHLSGNNWIIKEEAEQ